jgi:hypothetical protein
MYGGQMILYKHCSYYDFLKFANDEEKKYFAFSSIRNPLDDAVSRYFKLKTNHRERYTNREKVKRRRKLVVERIEDRLFDYIQQNDADFETFFLKAYRVSYNDWSALSHNGLDYVIRFENLQGDFSTVLGLIGIEQNRPLPTRNKTGSRQSDFLSYYTPPTIKRAKRVFGPYMKQWGYEFPPNWGSQSISKWSQVEFEIFTFFRSLYWKHFRYRIYSRNRRAKYRSETEFHL